MKEWLLRLLIVFSLVSITGLVIIQAYWIRDAIEIKQNHFQRAVNQAVTNAVWNLEQMAMNKGEEARKQAIERYLPITGGAGLPSETYPITHGKGYGTDDDTSPRIRAMVEDRFMVPGDSVMIQQPRDTSRMESGLTPDGSAGEVTSNYLYPEDSLYGILYPDVNRLQDDNFIRNYIEKALGSLPEHDNDPLSQALIDSGMVARIITEELTKEGIRLDFVFGIYLPFSGNLVFSDTLNQKSALLESEFVYNLYPTLRLTRPAYLLIHFPGRKHYLFSRLGMVLSLSVLLTIILVSTFYYITRSIYRQKKLGEMKNDFINNMTHEFKTPVSTISLACEALRDKDIEKSTGLVENYIHIIEVENRRLGKLAESILQTAVIDKGHLFLSFETFDIHALILLLVQKYQPVADQLSGMVSTKLLATHPELSGDRSHLYSMISNLLDNAIKYAGKAPEVEILTTDQNDYLTISIKDNGVGISKSNIKRIFEKLYRVPTGNVHNVKGFGLGLSYVKYIVERHEGIIRVESELNKGSIFSVTLPRNRVTKKP